MKRCLIVGKPNTGKTLFMLNFADYLGIKNIEVRYTDYDRNIQTQRYDIKNIRDHLSSDLPYKTMGLQSVVLDIPILKGKKEIEIFDSSGLTEGIHNNIQIRRSMAQTLIAMQESDIILHMVDISALNAQQPINSIGEIDCQIAEYGLQKEGYAILANKMDLIDNNSPIIELQKKFLKHYVIPISALTKQGFGEVKSYVGRRA